MPPIDDPLLFRTPTASSPLLSAALGGLLWLAASCRPSGDATTPDAGTSPDLGTTADAGVSTDAGATADSGPSGDAGTAIDAGTDAGAAADASMPMDAMALMDATVPTDAGAAIDAMVPRDAPCDVQADRAITSTDAAPGLTLAEFTAMCDGLGGFIEIHPHCGGMNTCAGISYDSGLGILTEHSCAGLNTCTGFSCVLP